MRNTIITLTVTGLMLLTGGSAARAASEYSAVYAFGDSLSDAGNLFIATGQPGSTIPQQPLAPYSDGRFTNGNTWVQDLSLMLGNGPLTPSLAGGNDFAYGGARTGSIVTTPANPNYSYTATAVDLPSQLAQFNAEHPTAPSTALYTLDIGANDTIAAIEAVLNSTITQAQANAVVSQAAQNAANFATALHAEGATRLLLFNVPDLGGTPLLSAVGSLATSLAAAFNADLATDLLPVEASGLTVTTLDAFSLLDDAVANPSEYGFTNATAPCWTGTTTDPNSGTLCSQTQAGQDEYLFWDSLHPTEAGHQILADRAIADLQEPSGIAAVAGGLLVVLGLTLRRGLRGEATRR